MTGNDTRRLALLKFLRSAWTNVSARQIAKEFWLPLTLATAWSLFNVAPLEANIATLKNFINVLGGSFFFLSWINGQWLRIRKQIRTDNLLNSIESRVTNTLEQLTSRTDEIIAQITGGDSFCYLMPLAGRHGNLMLIQKGPHPVYDVSVRICDIDSAEALRNKHPEWLIVDGKPKTDQFYKWEGPHIPGYAMDTEAALDLVEGRVRSFNIFMFARNGAFTQQIKVFTADGERYVATQVLKNVSLGVRAKVFEQIDEKFPRDADGTIKWR